LPRHHAPIPIRIRHTAPGEVLQFGARGVDSERMASAMAPDDLIAKLIDAGALDAGQAWTARPLGGGLNTRVYHLRSEQDPRGYIARLRERGSFAGEAEMLAAAAGCP